MRVLITGGAGFIGTHLRKRIIKEGHRVRILDNLLPQVHGPEPGIDFPDCEFIRGDVRDTETVKHAVKDIELVYHLAAETGVGQSQYEIERYISTNTWGTAVVLQAAAQAGVQQVLISSSRAVYGDGVHKCKKCNVEFAATPRSQEDLDNGRWEVYCSGCGCATESQYMKESDPMAPTSVYGLTKVQQEQLADQVKTIYNLPITILRLFNVYGPGQSLSNPYVGVLGTFFRQISSGKGIEIYEDGLMRRDFVYVEDVVEAMLLSAGNRTAYNQIFNVGSGAVVTLGEAGEEMFRALNKVPQVSNAGRYRLGDIRHAIGDISRIREYLDYSPSTSFDKGLRNFVAWANGNGRVDASIDSIASNQLAERNLLRQANQ